jgi:hypothetical protein
VQCSEVTAFILSQLLLQFPLQFRVQTMLCCELAGHLLGICISCQSNSILLVAQRDVYEHKRRILVIIFNLLVISIPIHV